MGCETMPTQTSHDSYGLQEREALQRVLENLSMIGLNSNLFEKHINEPNDNELSLGLAEQKRVSANITENIPVPSSEHVAEIVGKQGCKIKALRSKTNTYIKTPGRGDEPVFIITGRREDVDVAKAEILQASDHFSNIRAQRKGIAPPPVQPGQITKTIRVPYRVVGLVVGPKGQTIKQIQQKTQTYIVTPSRERDPVFEITGQPDSVEQARLEISNYIAARTGTFIDSEKKAIAPATPGNWNSERKYSDISQPVPEEISEFLEDLFSGSVNLSPKNGISKRGSIDNSMLGVPLSDELDDISNIANDLPKSYMVWNQSLFKNETSNDLSISGSPSPPDAKVNNSNSDPPSSGSSGTFSTFSFELSPLVRSSSFPNDSGLSLAPKMGNHNAAPNRKPAALLPCSPVSQSDPWSIASNGLSETTANHHSHIIEPTVAASSINENIATTSAIATSVATAIDSQTNKNLHCNHALLSNPNITKDDEVHTNQTSATSKSLHTAPINCSSLQPATQSKQNSSIVPVCMICNNNKISAALVPCGHNLFCYECVSSLVQSTNAFCPVCHQHAEHALRILQ